MAFGEEDQDAGAFDTVEQIPDLFLEADRFLFKQRNFSKASSLYNRIIKLEPSNIDAINSLAYCIKFQAASSQKPIPNDLFETVQSLYKQALLIDPHDVEANFNLGSLYL